MATQTARPYHHGNLRTELLDRALRIVREGGADALSLRELARQAGVSHAAPRRHFPDRGALLDAVAVQGFARLRTALEESVRATTRRGLRGRVAALGATYVRFALRDPALLELMFAAKHRQDDGAVREAADEAFAVALDVIARAQAAGELRGSDPEVPAKLLFALLQGLAALSIGEDLDDASIDATVAAAADALLDGLRPRA